MPLEQREEMRRITRGVRRIPQHSIFYERIVPLAMILLGLLMAVIVLFAMGVLIGVIPYK